jgi:hypothetical protein
MNTIMYGAKLVAKNQRETISIANNKTKWREEEEYNNVYLSNSV